MVNICA